MKDFFVCPCGPAAWDWRDMDAGGLAGSETCVIEISRRLARRGHDVTVLANVKPDTPDDGPVKWRSVQLFGNREIDVNEAGNWWLCRHPPLVDWFQTNHPGQRLILRCDDMHYGAMDAPNAFKVARQQKLDHIQFMSAPHRDAFKSVYPFLDLNKTSTIGCGIARDRIEKMSIPERDPYRIIWPNCPNRGLEHAIAILQEARKQEPRLELHIYYGFDGMDAAANGDPNHPDARKKALILSLDHTNVTFHGRVNKETLWDAYLRSNVWLYPSTFSEAGVVSAMEAQACGAFPICPPEWGLKEKVKNGILIEGAPANPAIQRRYVESLLKFVREDHSIHRTEMIDWALGEYDWEKVIDHHEAITGCLSPQWIWTHEFSESPETGRWVTAA